MRPQSWSIAITLSMWFCLISVGVFSNSCDAQELTRKEKAALRTIGSTLERAGRQFESGKFDLSGKSIDRANAAVAELANEASPELIEMLKPEYRKLSKAFELLTAQGITLDAIAPLPEPMAGEAPGEGNENAGAADGDAVSFKDAVAPIIVAKCGRCHVRGQRGRFSAATFVALMNSGHVEPGQPNRSRLIEVIEDGDMPPGGSLLDQELATLKLWIAQGAKTDAGQNDNIATLAQNANAAPAEEAIERPSVAAPTGKETVSFSTDIAPVLIENCSGCHVDAARNPRGGLNMTNFRQLLNGGDSGPMIKPGSGAQSLLIKKLRGTAEEGVQMPQGRPPLDESVIKMVSTWIDEGARFDGDQPGIRVRIVAAKARAGNMSHAELSAERQQLATNNWRTVMSDIKANTAEQSDLRVFSSYDTERVDEIGELAQTLIPKIRAAMDVEGNDPLVKGKISVFVFERRYDFNEFGVMIDRQEIPTKIKSRWGYDVIDANVAVLMTRNQTPEDLSATLTRQMGATYLASLAPDAPRWFADGMGIWIASKAIPRSEEVGTWDEQAEEFANQMAKPDDFIKGRIPDDRAALVGFYFVSQLRSNNSGKFSRLLGMLAEGQPFEMSFSKVYGKTPAKYVGGK